MLEVESKQYFLATINLGYKNQYEFKTGSECFDFIDREFGFKRFPQKNTEVHNVSSSGYVATANNYQKLPQYYENLHQQMCNDSGLTLSDRDVETNTNLDWCSKLTTETNSNNIEIIFESSNDEKIQTAETENADQKFSCNICNKDCLSNQETMDHLNSHIEKHICPFCAKKFAKKSELIKHCTLHLTRRSSSNNQDVRDTNIPVTKPTSENRSVVFNKENNLKVRKKLVHSQEKTKIDLREYCPNSNLKCDISKENDNDLRCPICLVVYSSSLNVSRHLKKFHRAEIVLFNCTKCFREFTNKRSLYIHLRSTHMDKDKHEEIIKSNKCPICFKKFSNVQCTRQHLKQIHGSKFLCSICNKNFSSKYQKNRHSMTHVRKQKYQCDICAKQFITKYNLEQHLRVHPKQVDFECTVCLRTFTDQINLTNHMAHHLNNESTNESG